jgi:hypothetical protein
MPWPDPTGLEPYMGRSTPQAVAAIRRCRSAIAETKFCRLHLRQPRAHANSHARKNACDLLDRYVVLHQPGPLRLRLDIDVGRTWWRRIALLDRLGHLSLLLSLFRPGNLFRHFPYRETIGKIADHATLNHRHDESEKDVGARAISNRRYHRPN